MNWPSDAACKRVRDVWTLAYGSSNPGEAASAFVVLKRLQTDLGLSDIELAFIAEYTEKRPQSRIDQSGLPELNNPLELILYLFDKKRIILSLERKIAVALWALHTHVFRQFLHSPRLIVRSFEAETGKTLLMCCLRELTYHPLLTGDASGATIYYRLKDIPDTTFLIDEAEHSVHLWGKGSTFLSVFDNGYRQGIPGHRVIGNKLIEFECFGPLALAGVAKRRYSKQMLSRSYAIDTQQSLESEDELYPGDPECAKVYGLVREWVPTFQRPKDCKLLFRSRARNIWRVAIEIAETLGYGATARAAAMALHRPSDDPVILLLFDIRRIFVQCGIDRIWTFELLDALHELEDGHWDEFWGINEDEEVHKLRKSELYALLKTKSIMSGTVWKNIDGRRVCNKGFYAKQFEPWWQDLFGDTLAQSSKVISLPRHARRHSGEED
jgi:hypothetical protein